MAMCSGLHEGLSLIVGPPGTGKTDVAVQIIACIMKNFPEQRTLVITHSNQALNDLFEKIMARGVPPRRLLRLGMGEKDLHTAEDFTRQGRVDATLTRRLELLQEVTRLASVMGLDSNMASDAAATCESAASFYLTHILSAMEAFETRIAEIRLNKQEGSASVPELFPFTNFFPTCKELIFDSNDFGSNLVNARAAFKYIRRIFEELEECRPFEVLRLVSDRGDYLLTKQAKLVAMTCTHAALKRREFLKLGLAYDNVVIEESGQILEIETLIPLLLQVPQGTDSLDRLRRLVLIGDHQQLPPVVQNTGLQRYGNLDQSLFARLVRLDCPRTQLDRQGRARTTLADLYRWQYTNPPLGDLELVNSTEVFRKANAGLVYDYQFVDVQDYLGYGESEPNPHFVQNLGEAEFVVATYQYLRLLGYDASKIAILTTYRGQEALLNDIIEDKCVNNPLYGRPQRIATVDRFQGQQADIVLISLVRTKIVGHIRDVRRLVVALSRARLGLYLFGRQSLFESCYELRHAFSLLLKRPTQLSIVRQEERHPTMVRCGRDGLHHGKLSIY